MQVKSNQVPIKCDCESLGCEQLGTHRAGACDNGAVVKAHVCGLAANLCEPCRRAWVAAGREDLAEYSVTFTDLPTQVKAAELKTPKGKTFPRAARVHGPTAGECSVCAEMKVGA